MKTLVLHPQDSSTDFLKPIYTGIKNKTVLSKNVSRDKLLSAVRLHDTIIMLGHGSPNGLFNVSGIGEGVMVVDKSLVEELRGKQLIAIWCHANLFIERHSLSALYSGMFISEVNEAFYCGVQSDQAMVNESNDTFAVLLGNMLTNTSMNLEKTHDMVLESYEELGEVNAVAKYNSDRLYYSEVNVGRQWFTIKC